MGGAPARKDTETIADDLRVLGAPPEIIEQWVQKQQPEQFEVAPENRDAVRLFVACSTQWRRAGMGGVPVGLDYAGVEAAARLLELAPAGAIFAAIRVMERAALAEMAERAPK